MPRKRPPPDERGSPGRRRCPACKALSPVSHPTCDQCGHAFPARKPPRRPYSPEEIVELVQRRWQYVESIGGEKRSLEVARQLRWLVERFGGWDHLLQALDVSSRVRISDGTSQREAAG